MRTEIWCANILIGNSGNPIIIEKVSVKKLPLHIILSDDLFINKLIRYVGSEKKWQALIPKGKHFPTVKIVYLKFISYTNKEPIAADLFRSL